MIMLSACGFRCDLCPALERNVSCREDQEATSSGWKKYYDIDLPPDQIVCGGCRVAPAPGRELPARKCETRDCVTERGLDNCGQCEEYPCERKESLMRDVERTIERHAKSVSPAEYAEFFEPYDARRNFEELRNTGSA
jgi:Protein of unknown function (DUF3795)